MQRFHGETVQDALKAVRHSLGGDAFVLSTRVVPAAGWRGLIGRRVVEVMAAAQRLPVSANRHVPAAPEAPDPRELRAQTEVAARLEATGLDAAVARAVADALPRGRRRGTSTTGLRRTLQAQLAPLSAAPASQRPIEVFVGPPGVGKTTTIAKIAARARAASDARRFGLVAADGFRVGAVEQLRLFAEIIGSPLTIARTPRDLERALAAPGRRLLVDTAGRSPKDDASREMLRVLARHPQVRTHLVLAAGTSPAAARRILDRFSEAAASSLVLTKLDEAETIAPLVSVIRDRGLRVEYLGTGQSVPDDLEVATPAALAAWVAGDRQREAVA
ncbi:MAG: hypothetical protein AB7P99_07225 [Vicinamibacterales bacterium]